MKFVYYNFTCDVDIFRNEKDILIRFYDVKKEPSETELHDLVIVDSGYGFLCLKHKGDDGILSGYLDKAVFKTEDMVYAAIDYLEGLLDCSIEPSYYHVDFVKLISFVEYNGEY